MLNEKDYEVRVKYEGGIMVTASSESDTLKRVKKSSWKRQTLRWL